MAERATLEINGYEVNEEFLKEVDNWFVFCKDCKLRDRKGVCERQGYEPYPYGFCSNGVKGPRGLTWREIRDRLNELDDSELDMKALVWTPKDFRWTGELTEIVQLDPSTDPDCAVNEDNPLSFTLDETEEW